MMYKSCAAYTLFSIIVAAASAVSADDMNLHVSIVDPEGALITDNELSAEKLVEASVDLCASVECLSGERCSIVGNEAFCECIEHCELPSDQRQKICSSSNKTFDSECHFLRQKCWCNKNDDKCIDPAVLNHKLDYYGSCRYIEQCSEEQKRMFPGRMKSWLDEVLHILNERKDLEPRFIDLVKLADDMKRNASERFWLAGVTYEFCQLDKSHDLKIAKEELRALVSSIKSLENCIQPFLDECDADNNGFISDNEWATCLDLSESDVVVLREYCKKN